MSTTTTESTVAERIRLALAPYASADGTWAQASTNDIISVCVAALPANPGSGDADAGGRR